MIWVSFINTAQLCTLNLPPLHWLFWLKCTCLTAKWPINLLRFLNPLLPFLLFVLSMMFQFLPCPLFLFLFFCTLCMFMWKKKKTRKCQIKTLNQQCRNYEEATLNILHPMITSSRHFTQCLTSHNHLISPNISHPIITSSHRFNQCLTP